MKNLFFLIQLSALLIFCPAISQAYYSTMTTGELVKEGDYKLTGEIQFVTSDDKGANFIGHFETGFNDEAGLIGSLGVGTTDFQVDALFKWIPIPDYGNQPALGILTGVSYANFNGFDDLSLRFHPLISKTFEVEIGDLTPYAALPFGLRSMDGENDFPVQFVLGSEWKTLSLNKVSFIAELGFDVSDAFTYFSLGATFQWDDEGGFSYE